MPLSRPGLSILIALAIVYIVWGSTYYAIKVAIQTLPPLGMLAVRFMGAGALLYLALRWRGAVGPTLRQWGWSAVIGTLLLGGGTGLVTLAEREASSSVAALMIAVSPLFASLFARLSGERTSPREWWGIGLGLLGIILLNLGELHATPTAALLLLLAPLCWTAGSQWSRRLPLPAGLMGSAAQMLSGGTILLLLSLLFGESWSKPSVASLWATIYLMLFGSLLAYSAYMYLVAHTRAALATSYAYVNPVVAIILGTTLGNEHLSPLGWLALLIIVAGMCFGGLVELSVQVLTAELLPPNGALYDCPIILSYPHGVFTHWIPCPIKHLSNPPHFTSRSSCLLHCGTPGRGLTGIIVGPRPCWTSLNLWKRPRPGERLKSLKLD